MTKSIDDAREMVTLVGNHWSVSAGDALAKGVPDPSLVTSIRLESGANVPAIDSMGRPGVVIGRFFMY